MRHLMLAIQFLTILPVPSPRRCEPEDLGRAAAWFPLVGLLLGALLWLSDLALTPLFPRHLTDALLIALLAGLTGGLHLDGLADVCDGLAARGGRDRFLAVMKDSHVGALGVVGLVLALLVKYAALLALPIYLKRPALLLVPALARYAQLALLTGCRPAREDGLGNCVLLGLGPAQLLLATAATLPLAWLTLKVTGLAAWLLVTIWALAVRWYFTRRLGGVTGDIAGFASETGEIVALLSIVALTALLTWI